ncbi:MAG: ACT domain-containing protein [Lachnospiraceae bacterium]|jgi:hypothetical protein
MLKQVSIYAENRKGAFHRITSLLQEKNINILGSVTNDSAEYGIIRMVVDKPEEAVEALKADGYMCRVTLVLGVEVDDHVGALNQLLQSCIESNINIDYIYLCYNRKTGMPIMVMHTEGVPEVESCLKSLGYTVL